ncbi:hypothetical protein GCM10023264_08950 [Sphingomonas daechungensis]|uniref:Uncharacterized protein n=1 Tax=Sphingomonas daechungensis TaxID=1176646 RepID=A0ABX6T395_9SPHN|nr:hypothetical protein [Sphingomonas daechungensis]QNP43178.1 hypothetical protein H9L15_14815 [Sphingomonas daechungensis]
MVGEATIRHRELQRQAKELRQLAEDYQKADPSGPEERVARNALREFAENLTSSRMSEVYDVAYETYGPHAMRGVSACWTLVHNWNA